jgi:basic amino acid/polyamine antiporter, APA family
MARMAAPARRGLFATKPADQIADEIESGEQLRRAVGTLDLTALGIGAVIGTGIFVIIGEAVTLSGPGIILSFVLAGVTCVFSALSYAEMAASVPASGSAYTYSYATLGEFVAWIIGWDLIIEYGLSVAVVAVGWGGYLQQLLSSLFGIHLSDAISQPPGEGGTINLPAVFLVLAVSAVLIAGVRESARFNAVMVAVKLVVLAIFCVLAFTAFDSNNLTPFAPHGFNGIADAAALIFFAYIGFDAVSTSSEEVRDPGRSLPRAIIGSLLICTVVYIVVSLAAVGGYPWTKLAGDASPLATVVDKGAGYSWGADVVSFGALVAITSVVLTILYGQTRIMFSMCRDGLVPRGFAKLSERRRTPVRITLVFGLLVAALAAVIPLKQLAELVNIGTLFAFLLVNFGVIILRRTKPELPRPFRVPFVPVVPLIGAGLCVYLMTKLPGATWWRFGAWLAVGLVIYFAYGRRHSALQQREPPPEAGADPAAAYRSPSSRG